MTCESASTQQRDIDRETTGSPDDRTALDEAGWGLIFTGGANWGAVQAGAAKALFERGFRPEFIVGVSVGAINGAYLATQPSPDGVEALLELWETADAAAIFGSRVARIRELAAVFSRESAFSNRSLRAFLERSIPARRFDDTTLPLAVVASELASGTSRLLSSGDLIDAVLASAALPGVFPPVEIAGELLMDGAIADPLPLPAVLERGIRRVVVVEAGRACGCGNDRGHVSGLLQRSVTVVMNDRMDLLVERVPPDVELVRLGVVCHPETSITDLSAPALRARLGYEQAVDVLDARTTPHRETRRRA